jgi:hypothetical protein
MNSMKTLSTLALGLATAASAFALTDGPYTGNYASIGSLSNLDWSGASMSVQGFNQNLGVLDSVTVTLFGYLSSAQSVLNLGGTTVTASVTSTATITLFTPNNLTLIVAAPTLTQSGSVAPGVPNQLNFSPVVTTATQTVTGSTVGLANFYVNGVANIVLPVTGTAINSASGGGSLFAGAVNNGYTTASITYNYHTAAVPEPKVYGAVGAVACLGLLGYRRYRSQKA